MLSRNRLSAVSDKRRAEKQAYDRARQIAWNRDKGVCQAAEVWPEVECAGQRVDVHHIRPVGQYPELRCEVSNLICLCRRHHQLTHDEPLRARALGLVK